MEKDKQLLETEWDLLTSTILNTELPSQIPKYRSEVQIMTSLYGSDKIYLCSMWLDDVEKRKADNKTSLELNELSTKIRLQGNDILKKGNMYNRLAAIKYTEAIYNSPPNSVNLALAHANRSVPLMNMEYYEEAYLDCEIARANGYPSGKLNKILERQACCLSRTKADSNSKCSSEHAGKLLKRKYSDKLGRFIVAGETIKFGDKISTESAFSFIPVNEPSDRKNFRFDCQNCAKVNVFPFPCNVCRNVSYCSVQCKKNHVPIHVLECNGYKFNLWYEIGIAHLAFRTFSAGFNDIWVKLNQFNHSSNNPGIIFKDISRIAQQETNFQYGDVLKLVTNFDTMDKNDIIIYGLTAVMLTMYLKQHTLFFENVKTDLNPTDLEIVISSIILRHLGQMVCNGHAIVELYSFYDLKSIGEHHKSRPTLGKLNEYFKTRRMFTAIFPKISILNHSCDPNIANRFNNCDLTIFASRDIKADEQIYNCYGPNYRVMRKSERKELLRQQYCFDCECTKCSNEENNYDFYICQNQICRSSINEIDYDYWYLTGSLPIIECPNCSIIQDYTWFRRLSLLFEKNCLNSFVEIFKIISTNTVYLSEWHELKEIIYEQVISRLIPVAERINIISVDKSLLQLIYENMQLKKMKYGELSGEYLHACTFLLDYIARKKLCGSPVLLDYDRCLINCKTILSNQAKLCFDNYLVKYVN